MAKLLIAAGVISERASFNSVPDLAAYILRGTAPGTAGSYQEVEAARTTSAGASGDVILCHVRGAYYFMQAGLLLTADGRVLETTALAVEGAPHLIARLPGMQAVPDGLRFDPPANVPRIARAMVWANLGATRNYGHFLFDALTGLFWADAAGLTLPFPPIAPPLAPWQHDLLRHAGLAAAVTEQSAKVIWLDEVIYLSTMNHYLHRNGDLLGALVARITPPRPACVPAAPPVYFSRRSLTGRILVNEPALETALTQAGVRVLLPERMTVAAQIAAVQGARGIVGASGAALANLCFLARGARLTEIRPAPIREPWLDLASLNLGVDHRVVPGPGPLSRTETPLLARLRQIPRRVTRRSHYAWTTDIAAVLDAALG